MGESPPRIDAHHHVWDLERRAQPWIREERLDRTFAPEEHETQLRRSGFHGAVLVQNLCEEGETVEMLALAAACPWIVGVVGWVDLAGDVDGAVSRLRAGEGGDRLVGVRHQVQFEEEADWLGLAEVRRGLERLGAYGLVFDAVVRPEQRGSVVRAAREVQGLDWVLDHLGNPLGGEPDDEWCTAIRALGALPNVAAKVSGLGNLAGADWTPASAQAVVRHGLAEFGADRLMFGSDWPVCLLTGDFPRVLAAAEQWFADVPAPARAEVFGGTARRWYAL